jgi:hypothetical protein
MSERFVQIDPPTDDPCDNPSHALTVWAVWVDTETGWRLCNCCRREMIARDRREQD